MTARIGLSATTVLLLFHVMDSMATTYDVSSIVLGQTIRVNFPPKANPITCAVSLAIAEINADTTLLPNTQLLARTLKTNCSAIPTVKAMLDTVAPYWDGYTAGANGPVIGIVGTYCSSEAMAASGISSWGRVPMIGYGATSPALSDKYKYPVPSQIYILGSDGVCAVVVSSLRTH